MYSRTLIEFKLHTKRRKNTHISFTGDVRPFQFETFTSTYMGTAADMIGYSLDFRQIPCNTWNFLRKDQTSIMIKFYVRDICALEIDWAKLELRNTHLICVGEVKPDKKRNSIFFRTAYDLSHILYIGLNFYTMRLWTVKKSVGSAGDSRLTHTSFGTRHIKLWNLARNLPEVDIEANENYSETVNTLIQMKTELQLLQSRL